MGEFGESEAKHLLASGWRQGSVFRANAMIAQETGLAEGTLLVVLTQSCTVVNEDIVKDPWIEVAAIERDPQPYSANSPQAKGRMFRKLSVPLDESGQQVGFVVDINVRRFLDRRLFLGFAPDGPVCSVAVGESIGRWVGLTYSRAALPNNLVRFFREEGVKDKLEKVFKTKREGQPIHGSVSWLYADWSSDDEVDHYDMTIAMVCDDEFVAMELDEMISKAFGREIPLIHESERLRLRIKVHDAKSVPVSEFDHMRRFSEWDFLTGLGEELG
ncbi:hypothetical protein [Rhizobium sp. FKL33]|jgi:hypothetical protein|uniref:hypothetical protein n=1 Tax=Rhizobium sp. FKL33 TaxID=2562307 RepID=UPI0010BFFDD6|nr:hypothetical protein [Rhizobium sp. FKL33]